MKRVIDDQDIVWQGAEILVPFLVPLETLRDDPAGAGGDLARVREALEERGQVRPVLVAANGSDVVARQHIVDAARELGWTHVATRLKVAEEISETADQMTLLDVMAQGDPEAAATLARKASWEEAEGSVDEINDASKDPDHEWIGLPEFVPASEAFKVVISCDTEDDRDALFDVLGIATIHKGTRGTLSVWWPDRARKDLASLRFVSRRRAS